MNHPCAAYYRREITWNVFNEKANRFANLLVERGIKKGEKVGILLMNCLEWLPIYFGILKAGALAVPLNFRYSADRDQVLCRTCRDRYSGIRAGVHRTSRGDCRRDQQRTSVIFCRRRMSRFCGGLQCAYS